MTYRSEVARKRAVFLADGLYRSGKVVAMLSESLQRSVHFEP